MLTIARPDLTTDWSRHEALGDERAEAQRLWTGPYAPAQTGEAILDSLQTSDGMGFMDTDGVFYPNPSGCGHSWSSEQLCVAHGILTPNPQNAIMDRRGWVKFEMYGWPGAEGISKFCFTKGVRWLKPLTKSQIRALTELVAAFRAGGATIGINFEKAILEGAPNP